VIPAGDDVDSALQQLLGQARRQSRPGGRVLAIGDDHVQLELVPQVGQRLHHRQPSRLADDVADEADAKLSRGGRHRA
jgi:hypothetical protein